MKKLLLSLILGSLLLSLEAVPRYKAVVSPTAFLSGNEDCKVYSVHVFDTHNNEDPTTWTLLSSKYFWSEGCDFDGIAPDPNDFNDSIYNDDLNAVIVSDSYDGACLYFDIEIYDQSMSLLVATGHIEHCASGKRSIEDHSEEMIHVYPTMVDEKMKIVGLDDESETEILVFTTNGALVLRQSVTASKGLTEIVCSHLSKGNYYMIINTNGKTSNHKFIISCRI